MINNFDQQDDVYTVSRLNSEVKFILEENFTQVWVEGEISNFIAPQSGHWYFSLKDPTAQIKCAMFKGSQRKLNFTPKDGMHILLRGRVSVYEPRGDYQLIADFMEERGEGKLQRAFEALKKKLLAAGLFAEEHKKPLPLYPEKIGVVTSPTGAAIRDILNVLRRRYPCAEVVIYPTLVQGATAAPAIVAALESANARNECDVILLARGGGSLEDLWPFNEEIVAQAIFKSHIPVISGIGHEVDFTIADFVADMRAPTPSAAAELATPDKQELMITLDKFQAQLMRQMKTKLMSSKQEINWIEKNLLQQHPKRRLLEKAQQLDYYELTLLKLQTQLLNRLQSRTQDLYATLYRLSPFTTIKAAHLALSNMTHQLSTAMTAILNSKQTALINAAATFDALSPLATLQRGFSIATTQEGKIIHNKDQVKRGDRIEVKLSKGKLDCEII